MQSTFDMVSRLKHENIAKIYRYGVKGFIAKPNKQVTKSELIYTTMQYIPGGSLLDFIDTLGGNLTEEQARFFFFQII